MPRNLWWTMFKRTAFTSNKKIFITLDQFNASLLYENINLFPGKNLLTVHLTFEL